MKKIVFLEGLPGVGKTTIIRKIDSLKINGVSVVDEVIRVNTVHNISTQYDYAENDNLKINKYKNGIIIIDRGPISTLSYNQTRKKIDKNFDSSIIINWFKKYKEFYKKDYVYTIYLTNMGTNFQISENDLNGPYGSIINQKKLEEITLHNCRKYCKNFKIIEYYKDNIDEVINEIIN